MSLYKALNIERPLIQYSVIHQPGPSVQVRDYQKNMLEMHRAIHAEGAAVKARWLESRREASDRTVQAIRGNLLQFLTTPLQSDIGEIKRVVGEQLEAIIDSVVPHGPLGTVWSVEGKFDVDPLKTGPLKSATATGKRLLGELGFRSTKAAPPIFESTFVVDGAMNLDILEHIVRDRLGIYASIHGKHIREAAGMTFAAHNLVHRRGEVPGAKGVEAVLMFAKGKIPYESFRRALTDALDAAWQGQHPEHVALWQRKLGLGRGLEFQLRIWAQGRAGATEFMDRLIRAAEVGEVGDALRKSALLYREILV